MKTIKTLILLILALTALGCTRGVMKTENISDLTNIVIDHHDRYVRADTELNQIKRNDTLVDSLKLRGLIKNNEVKVNDLGFFLGPLLKRFNAYIERDKKLKEVLRRTRLRSSEILRRILIEAGWQGG